MWVVCGLCVCVGCVCHRFGRYRTNNNAEKCIMQGGPENGYPMTVVAGVCGLCGLCVGVVCGIDSAGT